MKSLKKRYKKKEEELVELERGTGGSQINWFPGHMAKALRQVKENLKKVDLILEVRDARVPYISGNNELHKTVGQKHRLIVLNKVNLADPAVIEKWKVWFKEQNQPYIFLNSFEKTSVNELMKRAKDIVYSKREESSGNTRLRMMIIGLPNTGKSTIINHIANKKATKAAQTPGLTQHQQWIKIDRDIELLDTPGIMPPNIETDEQGHWLCAIHAIKDEIIGEENVAHFVVKFMLQNYRDSLLSHYQMDEISDEPNEAIEQIARKRHFVRHGGVADLDRAYKTILVDFRKGDLGICSFEHPPKK